VTAKQADTADPGKNLALTVAAQSLTLSHDFRLDP
jgi:hypothetical protein